MTIEKYDVWFLDDDVDKQAEKLFGIPSGEKSRVVHEEVISTSQGQRRIVIEIFKESDPDRMAFALARGILKPNAVLLDVNFQKSRARSFRFLDIPVGSEPAQLRSTLGIQILHTFKRIDPALPVVVLTETHGREFEFGRLGATDYLSKTTIAPNGLSQIQFAGRLIAAVRQIREVPVYDLEHHTVADEIAASYDNDERKRVGTVAYYRFENEIIAQEIGGLLQHRDHVRVLNVECGPGRIAEAIARQPWKGKVELVRVDFSANMLEAAYTALSAAPETYRLGFHEAAVPCPKGSKLSVSLFRAAAENLTFLHNRYPDGFDFLICGFGVPCYVNLDFVLPIDIGQKGAQGLVALARDDESRFLFSVYNERSLIFKTSTAEDNAEAVRRRPVAALMDLKKGETENHRRVHQMRCLFGGRLAAETRASRFGRCLGDPQFPLSSPASGQ